MIAEFRGKCLPITKSRKVDFLLSFLSLLLIVFNNRCLLFLTALSLCVSTLLWRCSTQEESSVLSMDMDQEKGKPWRFLAWIPHWHIKAEQTHPSTPHIPFLPSCLFSFCPKEGHFCPMRDDNVDVKRWVIDWEERGQRDSWHAADYSRYTEQLHMYVCVVCMQEYSFHVLYNMSNQTNTCILRGRGRMWALVSSCRPHELCRSLRILTCWGNWCNTALF